MKPNIAILFLAAVISPWRTPAADRTKPIVNYLVYQKTMSHEDSACVAWLESSSQWRTNKVKIEDIAGLGRNAIVWVHCADTSAYEQLASRRQNISLLKELYRAGGKLLVTDYAAMLPWAMGVETKKPEIRLDTIKNDWLWDKKGFQGFRGHPLFASLHGGEYVWDPNEDQILPSVGYFGDSFPERGRVIAVDKAYVFVYQNRKLVIEYAHKQAKIVSVGSAIYFGCENNARPNLEQFATNAILYLAGINVSGPRTHWTHTENKPREFKIKTHALKSKEEMRQLPSTRLLLRRQGAGSEFFDVAGRRALIMGKEDGGIDELWVHPFRILRDFEVGLVTPDSIAWLRSCPASIDVRPESFTRLYSIPGGKLKEVVYASLNRAGGNVYVEATIPVKLVIRFRSDLRWMWPYDANALGNVYYAYDSELNAVHVRDVSKDFYCIFGANCAPRAHTLGQFETVDWKNSSLSGKPTTLSQVYSAFLYDLNQSNDKSLMFAMVGTNEGERIAEEDYRALLEHPRSEYTKMVDHYNQLLKTTVAVESPDTVFNNLFEWAIVGTDRFVAKTPGVGEGLLAGYGTTARGWNGAQKISGRPGYAWYFGRDSEWSGFAIDDYGDMETVRKQLMFLQEYQDRTGKIFHEISTSGVVHYDAADATPLYPILAAHYLRASGDTAFLRRSWPQLQKAMEFLYSTDTDGDGLIENTNVGHGWVEGGALFGAHTEFYLAGLWSQTLSDMAYIADHLGEKSVSSKYRADAEKVRSILNTDFWNPGTHFFKEGKYKEGTYDTEPTALVAVPMYYGLLDDAKVRTALDAFAGNGFSSDWGVRMVSSSSRLFDPQGYHYGSIWPLFTGWVALGEYEYGNSSQAFMHLTNNLYLKKHWALGFVPEVMHGVAYKPVGVCYHQCWSETNILHPAIHGMIGWKPDAPSHSAVLAPRFPIHWDSVTIRHLRVGASLVSVTMIRGINRTTYTLKLEQGLPVGIKLSPEIPQGMEVNGATVNGVARTSRSETKRGLIEQPITVKLEQEASVVFRHHGGATMYPSVPDPLPNDSSQGYRILSESVKDSLYEAVLEGKSGTTCVCQINVFDQRVKSVNGGELTRPPQNGVAQLRISFDSAGVPFAQRRVRMVLGRS